MAGVLSQEQLILITLIYPQARPRWYPELKFGFGMWVYQTHFGPATVVPISKPGVFAGHES